MTPHDLGWLLVVIMAATLAYWSVLYLTAGLLSFVSERWW